MILQEKATVLIVDDEVDVLDHFSEALIEDGYNCIQATMSGDALEILDKYQEVDVIVSDIRLPGGDGIELLKAVKCRYPSRNWLNVIFVTGYSSLEISIEALRLGAVDFLQKPVRREQLLNSVKVAASQARSRKELVTKGFERGNFQQKGDKRWHSFAKTEDTAKTFVTQNRRVAPVLSKLIPLKLSESRMIDLLRTRTLKARYFEGRFFINPCWNMLLDLMENTLMEREVSVTSLYLASGVAPSTAARRLEELEKNLLVERFSDMNDGRRQFVRLTNHATLLLTNYLAAVEERLSVQ
ncbi:response regulator [Brucella anthropi]|uniref:response regulator n=1 Tax=Brucella anthropi TaxID=529 RepID=UPI00384C9407